MDLFALSVPAYLLLILAEAGYGAWKKKQLYRFNDTVANLNTGILSIIYGISPKAMMFFLYIFAYEHLSFFKLPNTWWAFIICLVAVDFCAYWFHRLSHEINLIWGSHIVHHRSEEFNFSVALRQSANGIFPAIAFFIPAAIVGVSPEMYTLMGTINLIYQFLLHTQTVGKLPAPIEYIFNTPSHHRVHHGVNPQYIDKNYSGIFIVFDRMFGTFRAEDEEVKYGITKPLESWNPLWNNIEHFVSIWENMKLTPRWSDKLRMMFGRPGWMPQALGGPQVPDTLPVREKFNTSISPRVSLYVLGQLIVCFSLFFIFYYNISRFTNIETYIYFGGLMLLYIIASTAMLEGKDYGFPMEVIKNTGVAFVIAYLFDNHLYYEYLVAAYTFIAFISLAWLLYTREEYAASFSEIFDRFIQR